MRIRESQSFGGVSESELSAFERTHGCKLPNDYRQFLIEHNGGDPRPVSTVDFIWNGQPQNASIKYFYGIHDGPDWSSLQSATEAYGGRIIAKGIPIADDEYGNQIVLIHHGRRLGSVFWWDHEDERFWPSFKNMHLIADSFSAFVQALYEYVDPDETEADRIIRENDIDAVRKLIGSDGDLEVTDEYDRTIIENATIHNRYEIIQLLAEAGASLRSALEIAETNLEFFPEHEASVKILQNLTENTNG